MSIKEYNSIFGENVNSNKENMPFKPVYPGYMGTDVEKENKSFLIKSYLDAEKKYDTDYSKVFGRINGEYAFKRDEDLVWVCSHCKYLHHANSAPNVCPVCGGGRAYFGLQIG